jgi:hypothetical protein
MTLFEKQEEKHALERAAHTFRARLFVYFHSFAERRQQSK